MRTRATTPNNSPSHSGTPFQAEEYAALPSPVAILALAAWALVGITAISFRLHTGAPLPLDNWLHAHVGVAPDSPPATFALLLAALGSALGAAVLTLTATLSCLLTRHWYDASIIATTMVIGVLSSQLWKTVSERPRPLDLGTEVHGASFPSGHSMGAAALAVALILTVCAHTDRRSTWRILTISIGSAWIISMMWSRIALHVHWATDTIAGALLGASVAVLVRYSGQQLRTRHRTRVKSMA